MLTSGCVLAKQDAMNQFQPMAQALRPEPLVTFTMGVMNSFLGDRLG